MNILFVFLLWFSTVFANDPAVQANVEGGQTSSTTEFQVKVQAQIILGGKRLNPRTVVALEDTPLKPVEAR